jgi:hypothetical protein
MHCNIFVHCLVLGFGVFFLLHVISSVVQASSCHYCIITLYVSDWLAIIKWNICCCCSTIALRVSLVA